MQSTNTTRDLLAGIRANLQIIRSDLRDLRTDLASDWRYLRADLRYDWLTLADRGGDLADNLRADLVTWRQQHGARQLPADMPGVPRWNAP
jgi:hypothetical protein